MNNILSLLLLLSLFTMGNTFIRESTFLSLNGYNDDDTSICICVVSNSRPTYLKLSKNNKNYDKILNMQLKNGNVYKFTLYKEPYLVGQMCIDDITEQQEYKATIKVLLLHNISVGNFNFCNISYTSDYISYGVIHNYYEEFTYNGPILIIGAEQAKDISVGKHYDITFKRYPLNNYHIITNCDRG